MGGELEGAIGREELGGLVGGVQREARAAREQSDQRGLRVENLVYHGVKLGVDRQRGRHEGFHVGRRAWADMHVARGSGGGGGGAGRRCRRRRRAAVRISRHCHDEL